MTTADTVVAKMYCENVRSECVCVPNEKPVILLPYVWKFHKMHIVCVRACMCTNACLCMYVMVEVAIMHLTHIQEVLNLNPSQDTSYFK